MASSSASSASSTSALTSPWEGPYGGIPPFDKVRIEDFESAFEAAMNAKRKAIDAITACPDEPTFENTVLAFELSGEMLDRVAAIYYVWDSSLSSPEYREVSKRLSPVLAAFKDEILQNAALFKRLDSVYQRRAQLGLSTEQDRLLWTIHNRFVRDGAALSTEAKARMTEINKELASLFNNFQSNLLHDEEEVLYFTREELDGLPEDFLASAELAAKEAGKDGGLCAVPNTRSAMEPVTTFATSRAVREKVFRLFVQRGDNGNEWDNKALIKRILALRFERAQLRGYATHAHYILEDTMAKTPEAAMALMESVWPAAVKRAQEEVADMQVLASADGITIEPWDYRFYAEKVRKAKYDLDEAEIKPFLQLEKLVEGMFWAASETYGYVFKPVEGLPVFHENVKTYEVLRGGEVVALFYFDPYARKGKSSGAWMTSYRDQSMDLSHPGGPKNILPIVSNNSNFLEAAPGEPILISWSDAITLFHEFGHALHGLSSKVTFGTLSGTNVTSDFVEFPSQVNERWLSTPQVLSKFALHHKTGEPMPAALLEKIKKADSFNKGFETVEYLSAALVDMKLHLAGGAEIDVSQFEKDTLAAIGMPKEIVMRHRTPQFAHIFVSDGYSAGYYSYLWADTLAADCAEAFSEVGSFYDQTVAKRMMECVLSAGNKMDPKDAYRAFRGRDADPAALMRARGFL